MNETREHRDAEQHPEPGYDALLRDLRSLPKVNAPLDFQHHLNEKLNALRHVEALPWWKRFFKPAREGGYQIPAFAYGAVATVVVLAVSVYVYRASFVEETFRSEQETPAEQVLPEQQDIDQPAQQPVVKEKLPPPSPSSPATPPAARQPELRPMPPPPVTRTPAPAPAKKSQVREEANATESNELKFRTRGDFDYDPEFSSPQDSVMRRLDSLRKLQMDRRPPNQPNPR